MKSCPKCKFLLTEHDASCRYCGHLVRGLEADDPWSSAFEGGVRVETDDHGRVARPAAVIRRARGEISTGAHADHPQQPDVSGELYDRSDVVRQHYSIEGQDDQRDWRRLLMVVVGVALVAVIVVALFLWSGG